MAQNKRSPLSLQDVFNKGKHDPRLRLDRAEMKDLNILPINHKGNIVGFYRPTISLAGDPMMGAIYVLPEYRKMGIAKRVVGDFYKKHPDMVYITTDTNIASQALAKSVGLRYAKRPKGNKHGMVFQNDASPSTNNASVKIADMCMAKHADAMSRAFAKGIISAGDAAAATKRLGLKPRFLKTLGSGAEGTASLMTDPTRGLKVMKAYNPLGPLFSNSSFANKVKTSRSLNRNPMFAKYYGRVQNKPVTFHEYVPTVSPQTPYNVDFTGNIGSFVKQQYSQAASQLGGKKNVIKRITIPSIKNKIMGRGFMTDITLNQGNRINGPDGTKIIDFLVKDKNSVVGNAESKSWKNISKSIGKNLFRPSKWGNAILAGAPKASDMTWLDLPPSMYTAAAYNYNTATRSFNPKFLDLLKRKGYDISAANVAKDLFNV